MKNLRNSVRSLLFLIICITLASNVQAETCTMLALKHNEPRGVGYALGYSTLDYFLISRNDGIEFILNMRGHLFNDAKAAGNGGLAIRFQPKRSSSLVGANFYYDIRDVDHFIAHQIGGGLEWISDDLDVRVNGYLPIRQRQHFSQHLSRLGVKTMVVNRLKTVLACIDGEIGTSPAKMCYLAAGSYYLFRETGHSISAGGTCGGKIRFDVDIGNRFMLGTSVTHDRIFGTRAQGYLALDFMLGSWKPMDSSAKKHERKRIVRNEIIPVQVKKKTLAVIRSHLGSNPRHMGEIAASEYDLAGLDLGSRPNDLKSQEPTTVDTLSDDPTWDIKHSTLGTSETDAGERGTLPDEHKTEMASSSMEKIREDLEVFDTPNPMHYRMGLDIYPNHSDYANLRYRDM